MEVQVRRRRGRPKIKWINRVRDDIKGKGLCMTEPHLGIYRQTSTPHISGTLKMT